MTEEIIITEKLERQMEETAKTQLTLEELKAQRAAAYKAYLDLDEQVDNYIVTQLKAKYKDTLHCMTCRYNTVLDFSSDGWHNKCGHSSAPCTCCNSYCEYYNPDTDLTLWIKKNISYAHISAEENRGLQKLGYNIFSDNLIDAQKKIIKIVLTQNLNIE